MMEIKTAVFSTSNTGVEKCPAGSMPEFAFIGRSNVGKSSLINSLVGNGRLAKTSSKPGKTLLINHFLINKSWYIVDLPGYGYAKVSVAMRERLHKMITDYVLKRENLYNLFVLVDSRLRPQDIDLDFISFLGENAVPFSLVFTKADKSSQAEVGRCVSAYKKVLSETWAVLPPMFVTSSQSGRGREDLLRYIDEIMHSSGK